MKEQIIVKNVEEIMQYVNQNKKIKNEELEEKAGIYKGSIWKWSKSGQSNPKLSNLLKLFDAMGIKLIVKDIFRNEFVEISSVEQAAKYIDETIKRRRIGIYRLQNTIHAKDCITRIRKNNSISSITIFLNILLYLKNEIYLEREIN